MRNIPLWSGKGHNITKALLTDLIIAPCLLARIETSCDFKAVLTPSTFNNGYPTTVDKYPQEPKIALL